MICPNCDKKHSLDWQLTACEFKCSNCGELFRICDLSKKGVVGDE